MSDAHFEDYRPKTPIRPNIKPLHEGHLIQVSPHNHDQKFIVVPISSLGGSYAETTPTTDIQTLRISLLPEEEYIEVMEGTTRKPKIKIGDQTYDLPQYIATRKERNAEAFHQMDPLLGEIYMRALEDHPELISINVRLCTPQDDPRINGSLGFFDSDTGDIILPKINLGSPKPKFTPKDYQKILNIPDVQTQIALGEYSAFIQNMADLIHVTTENVEKNIRIITLLHELGHAAHLASFIHQYGETGKQQWDKEGHIERTNMKLWLVNTSGIVTKFDKFGIRIEVIDWKQWQKEMLEKTKINSNRYRALSYEQYADLFMTSYIEKFKDRLFS